MRRLLLSLFLTMALVGPALAQRVEIDTNTSAYKSDSVSVTNLTTEILIPYARQLHLSGWRIVVMADALEPGTLAQTFVREEYRNAWITIDLSQVMSDRVRETVLHELIHIRVEPLASMARALAGKDEIAQEMVRQRMEALVTDLTRSMVQ